MHDIYNLRKKQRSFPFDFLLYFTVVQYTVSYKFSILFFLEEVDLVFFEIIRIFYRINFLFVTKNCVHLDNFVSLMFTRDKLVVISLWSFFQGKLGKAHQKSKIKLPLWSTIITIHEGNYNFNILWSPAHLRVCFSNRNFRLEAFSCSFYIYTQRFLFA